MRGGGVMRGGGGGVTTGDATTRWTRGTMRGRGAGRQEEAA